MQVTTCCNIIHGDNIIDVEAFNIFYDGCLLVGPDLFLLNLKGVTAKKPKRGMGDNDMYSLYRPLY